MGFCGNTVLVMGPHFRGGTNLILPRENATETDFSWGNSKFPILPTLLRNNFCHGRRVMRSVSTKLALSIN